MPPAVGTMQKSARRPTQLLHTGAVVTVQGGLEVPKHLQWQKWQSGGEFVKQLMVKNVSTQAVRFTYKLLPSNSPFSVQFPEMYKLSPGMTAIIKASLQVHLLLAGHGALLITCVRLLINATTWSCC
eukprot:GHRR01014878.1.p1 GENE.GHRR01014878.1~~GHRR01014878.1.p1  ORF type:complete len:127 (+),score=36.26 GHRR01014878.1:576-956(+)